MEILKQNKILFIALVLVILLFIGYGMSDQSQSTSFTRSTARTSPVEQEILQLLYDVQKIDLDSSIFQDPAFAVLRDFGREIIQEPKGRDNPFSDIQESSSDEPVVGDN